MCNSIVYANKCVNVLTCRPQSNDAWVLAKPGITQAVAIASFAYMCHHSTFLLYGSLKQPTEARWARLTHVSVFTSALIEIFFALFGYATFTGFVQGKLSETQDHLLIHGRGNKFKMMTKSQLNWGPVNSIWKYFQFFARHDGATRITSFPCCLFHIICDPHLPADKCLLLFFNLTTILGDLLENYCHGDHLMNAARIMFCVTILLTSPIECFVARDLIMNTLSGQNGNCEESTTKTNFLSKIIVTFSLVTATCLISFSTDCLSIVLEFNVRRHFVLLSSVWFLTFSLLDPGSFRCHTVGVRPSGVVLHTPRTQFMENLA